ncbi:hypothetical protein GVAV_000358 [Gurleya vavrai]
MQIFLKFKGKTYEIEADESETILQIKVKLENLSKEEFSISAKDMKFIATGKILKDDQTLDELKIVDKAHIFVSGTSAPKIHKEPTSVRNEPKPSILPPQNQPPVVDSNLLQNLMQQQLEQIQNDPNALDSQLELITAGMSEEEKRMTKENFMQKMHLMKDNPDLVKQAAEQISKMDPNTMQNMMRGAGYNMQGNQQMPGFNQNQFQEMQFPIQSPTIPCSHGFYPYGYKLSTTPVQPQEPIDFEKVYKDQLIQLRDMDFQDTQLNLQALIATKGDINAAIDYIFKNQKR